MASKASKYFAKRLETGIICQRVDRPVGRPSGRHVGLKPNLQGAAQKFYQECNTTVVTLPSCQEHGEYKLRTLSEKGAVMLDVLNCSACRFGAWVVLLCCLFGSATAHAAIPASERAVLLSIYSSTIGTNWTNKTDWGGAAGTECSWNGVTCTGNNVTSIMLNSNNLTGSLPSIGGLSALRVFQVGNNKITGSIPSISGLTALQQFIVSNNQFTGSIPSPSGLASLHDFRADDNQLTGSIPSLSGLTSLNIIIVNNNKLSGEIPTSPSTLLPGQSRLCGNRLSSSGNASINTAWNTATGGDWFACQTAATIYGLSGFQPAGPLPANVVAAQYDFRVLLNQATGVKIVFGFNRLYTPGNSNLYNSLETNLYADRLIYSNPVCTVWPLLGTWKAGESSLRIAAADYEGNYVPSLAGRLGVKTSDSNFMPLQSYLVDNIANLPKTDAITQANINGLYGRVTILRGDIATDMGGWLSCGGTLSQDIYRQWQVTLELENQPTTTTTFIFPDAAARYLYPSELLHFASELLNQPGEFATRFWNLSYRTEGASAWTPISAFINNTLYDGNGSDFGTRVVHNGDHDEVEVSNSTGATFLAAGVSFTANTSSVSTPVCTLAATPPTISPGGIALLSASCSPAATSYIWTGGYCTGANAASNTCMNSPDSNRTVSPTVTTTYAITGRNASGMGSAASATVTVATPTSTGTVVEFYNTNLDNYFITADANEAAQIDGGSAGLGWMRTGNTFSSGGSTPVCRFYGSQSPGPNSHFYTVNSFECEGLKQVQASTPATQKRWNFESMDFVSTPPSNGTCPAGSVPIYRAYNNGFTRDIDSNHRITSSSAAIQEVVNRGWSNEGVVMCAPQ